MGGLTAALLLLLIATACLPNPQRLEAGHLLDRLGAARGALSGQPPQTGAPCDDVADVKSRLLGEPGLLNLAPSPSLLDAADALQAVCGQATLLAVTPGDPVSPPVLAARTRWQDGITRELGVACDHLRTAAGGLGQSPPC